MIKKLHVFVLFLFTVNFLLPQVNITSTSAINNPVAAKEGIVFTDAEKSSLFIVQNGETYQLTSSPGSGLYFSLSSNKQSIGFKEIDANGNQIPSIVDVATKKITPLYKPVQLAGQVSFADDGTIAFTIGDELLIRANDVEKKYHLESYCNLAPISPDANYAVYNDNHDQLYLLNLSTGVKQKITNGNGGYFAPLWSPDGLKLLYSSLGGALKVFDLEQNTTYKIVDEGCAPVWSKDSKRIIFYKKETKNYELINSDLYLSNYDGTELKQLTDTKDQYECDPSFGLTDDEVIYSKMNEGKIVTAVLSVKDYSLKSKSDMNINIKKNETPHFHKLFKNEKDLDTLDIPYINQVYDTPDYYNGRAACGPTSSMMIVAFYKILPEWNITASWPYPHTSPYGRYISDAYRFRQMSYIMSADDPSGRAAQGAYGYMWSSSSPYSTMQNFYVLHGIYAVRADEPSYQSVVDEISAGRPYTVCNGLTTAGHIIVAHGTATQAHTLIYNDPYGNKNTPGYPSYDGKNAKYDWPGYNNGYQNLNTVYWGVSTKYTKPETFDTLIDDLDFSNGFYMNNKSPVTMNSWNDKNHGYHSHMWYATTTLSQKDSCYATWTPNIPHDGYYEVSAFIPYSQAEAAKYFITSALGVDTIVINQKVVTESWVSLGSYQFEKGKKGFVRLGDASSLAGQAIIFDAVKWSYIDSIETEINEQNISNPSAFKLEQNYPNPFNPSTRISYQVPEKSFVTLKVFDLLGKEVATLVNEEQAAGSHYYELRIKNYELTSGFYFYTMRAGDFVQTKKMVLLK